MQEAVLHVWREQNRTGFIALSSLSSFDSSSDLRFDGSDSYFHRILRGPCSDFRWDVRNNGT